jgi:predicted RNA polymerase sigma factor
MAQRISRAKRSIQDAGARFEPLTEVDREARLASVMHVLYLIFNEGYAASSGPDVVRADLSSEALRLTRMLHRLAPEDPEVAGLLALMLLTDARRAARTGSSGELIPLDKQDRTRWDRRAIDEGVQLVTRVLGRGHIGPYQVQAAIAAAHDEAPSAEETDWNDILGLYGVLQQLSESPMVALNHAIALAMVHGPAAGIERLDALTAEPQLANHYRLDAVRGHLLERLGATDEAIVHYRRAAERTASRAERDYLILQIARLNEVASRVGI